MHLFLDNAVSTNKNDYLVLGNGVGRTTGNKLHSSIFYGCRTQFAPDRFFAKVAKAFANSDVSTTEELASLVSDYAAVIIDNGELVSRDKVGEKYNKLPGIRELRISLSFVIHPLIIPLSSFGNIALKGHIDKGSKGSHYYRECHSLR